MRNIRIDLCYEGTRYKGWQRLPTSSQTIQGKLEQTLSRILQEPIEIIGCGRTDAGTHARFYTANFHCSSAMDCQELYMELCRYLPEDIGIYSVRNVSERFHARLNAKTKTYRYRVWQSEKPCVFERKYVLIDRRAVDIDAIQAAADLLEGTHDFSAFCANKNMKKSTVRHIEKIIVKKEADELVFEVTGNGFLHHMVRIIVGTLLEVGREERSYASIPALFGAPREQAGELVSAAGLCLVEVNY